MDREDPHVHEDRQSKVNHDQPVNDAFPLTSIVDSISAHGQAYDTDWPQKDQEPVYEERQIACVLKK